ncbi:outer membrane protein [Sphingomonas adhaesiva]|uniref:outer membrane protein n=1 Tax=Sphingomonas adhaesiva TaxID=28212 RepID=UPI002FF5A9C2
MHRTITMLAATAAATALFAFATPSSAQDRATFTGPRAEVTVGYDSTRLSDQPAGAPRSVSQARLGAAVGYDVALGSHWTLGAEAGIGGTLGGGRDVSQGATRFNVDQGRDLDASLRLGYKAGSATLLYAKAGWANSRYSARAVTGTTRIDQASDENGFRVGAGVEQMLGERVYAKAEYRYTTYGEGVHRHQALAGLGMRF